VRDAVSQENLNSYLAVAATGLHEPLCRAHAKLGDCGLGVLCVGHVAREKKYSKGASYVLPYFWRSRPTESRVVSHGIPPGVEPSESSQAILADYLSIIR
jgi:hypothetical protein